MNSYEKDLSTLWRMYNKGSDNNPSNLNNGRINQKNNKQAIKKTIYKNSFEIKSLITDKVYTNMTLPAIFDAIGNNFLKIGLGISAIIASIGYLIEKIKG